MEFDALFIRQTTAVNHITYQLTQKADLADMVVIDDPASIIRCTNKDYLKELLDREQIPCPRSHLIFRKDPTGFDELSESLGATIVVKIPDGSFSVGIAKVSSHQEYEQAITELF